MTILNRIFRMALSITLLSAYLVMEANHVHTASAKNSNQLENPEIVLNCVQIQELSAESTAFIYLKNPEGESSSIGDSDYERMEPNAGLPLSLNTSASVSVSSVKESTNINASISSSTEGNVVTIEVTTSVNGTFSSDYSWDNLYKSTSEFTMTLKIDVDTGRDEEALVEIEYSVDDVDHVGSRVYVYQEEQSFPLSDSGNEQFTINDNNAFDFRFSFLGTHTWPPSLSENYGGTANYTITVTCPNTPDLEIATFQPGEIVCTDDGRLVLPLRGTVKLTGGIGPLQNVGVGVSAIELTNY